MIAIDCTDVFNFVKRNAVLTAVAARVPGLTLVVPKCYDDIQAHIASRTNFVEMQYFSSNTGIQSATAQTPLSSVSS